MVSDDFLESKSAGFMITSKGVNIFENQDIKLFYDDMEFPCILFSLLKESISTHGVFCSLEKIQNKKNKC